MTVTNSRTAASTAGPASFTSVDGDKGDLASSASPRPLASLLGELRKPQHLWKTVKSGLSIEDPCGCVFWSMMASVFALLCWIPSLDGDSWQEILNKGFEHLSVFVMRLTEQLVRTAILLPLYAGMWLFGAAYFLMTHGAAFGWPLALIYSSYSNRIFSLSSLFSFPINSPPARCLDYLPFAALIHSLIVVCFGSVPLPALITLYSNTFFLVFFNTSIPLLFLETATIIEGLLIDGTGVTGGLKQGEEAVKPDVVQLEKELAELKEQLKATTA